MKRIRLWLLGLAMLAIVAAGGAGWPGALDGPTSTAAGPVSAVVGGPQTASIGRGQRW